MADKCVVCGYAFQRKDFNAAKGIYICPYCGTEKRTYSTNEDFERKDLLTRGYEYLSKSDMKNASEEFHSYSTKFPEMKDDELILGEALAKLELSNSLNYERNKLLTIVHTGSVEKIIRSSLFNTVVKDKNHIIYENVMEMADEEKKIIPQSESVMLISTDLDAAGRLSSLMSNYKTIVDVDITLEDTEVLVYRNIPVSSALLVYVDDPKFLDNAYFMSIYYRFKARGKNVVFVCEEKDDLQAMFNNDCKVDYHDNQLLDQILIGVNKKSNQDVKDSHQSYILKGADVVEILDPVVSLPTNVVNIYSMAGYQKELSQVTATTTGVLIIGERAFSESSMETFIVQSKTCNLELKREVFSGCRALKSVNFMNQDIKFIDDGQFRDCISLREINLSNQQINEIPAHCFDGDKVLANVVLPKKITKIGKYAFRNTLISSVEVTSDTEIAEYAFLNAPLSKVTITPGNAESMEITEDTFPSTCHIIFKGKELKKMFKTVKKNYGKYYNVELEK